MLEAALWGIAAASSLMVGALIGIWAPVPRWVVAWIMGFGAGALVSALAFDLTAEAFQRGGTAPTAIGLAAGAVTFFLGDLAIRRGPVRRQRRERRRDGHASTSGGHRPRGGHRPSGGLAIVLGVLLDGIPESIVLGATLIGGVGVSVSFLAAVFVSNLPEGMGGARDLADEGFGRGWILALWLGVILASALGAAFGNGVLGKVSPETLAVAEAFAAGAILAMLADTMFPEAFAEGGDTVGLASVLGFALAFFLSRG